MIQRNPFWDSVTKGEIPVSSSGASLEARLEWIGAMATSGVEAGRGSPGPAEAIVGNNLVALRNDLSEFMGWTVDLRDGNEGTTSGDANAVTISVREEQVGRGSEVLSRSLDSCLTCLLVVRLTQSYHRYLLSEPIVSCSCN